jgi:hypothetical protein
MVLEGYATLQTHDWNYSTSINVPAGDYDPNGYPIAPKGESTFDFDLDNSSPNNIWECRTLYKVEYKEAGGSTWHLKSTQNKYCTVSYSQSPTDNDHTFSGITIIYDEPNEDTKVGDLRLSQWWYRRKNGTSDSWEYLGTANETVEVRTEESSGG